MSMAALPHRIASACVVVCGVYGDVTRQPQERQMSRQAIYRESQRTLEDLEGAKRRATLAGLQERVGVLEAQAASLQQQLSQAAALTPDVLRQFAATGEARGVSLADVR